MDNRVMYSPYRTVRTNGELGKTACSCARDEMLEDLRRTDFAILDAVLYLDVYPDCKEALDYIVEKNRERRELCENYEAKYGALTMYGITKADNTNTPWPWQWQSNGS